jgi:hypothetical protein
MGPVPAAGQWALLTIPASRVGLEGVTVSGMAFTLFDGRATWDYAGDMAISVVATPPPTNTGSLIGASAWMDDTAPAGALLGSDGGDTWNWISSNPSPFSGARAWQSSIQSGEHQVFVSSAAQPMAIGSSDVLFAYVYLDPNNLPSEVMLQWNDGSGWDHRAYWGANSILWGTDGTASRQSMGALPAAGQWALLQVPVSAVGLQNSSATGVAFTLYGGRATWDYAGKASGFNAPTNPISSGGTNNTSSGGTNTTSSSGSNTNSASSGATNTTSGVATNVAGAFGTNGQSVSLIDYTTLELPKIGGNTLHVLTPTLLELKLINTKQPDPAAVTSWNFVNSSGSFTAPPASSLSVTVNGNPVNIASIGFKRRPLYAPWEQYDLRIENSLYLQLTSAVSDNQVVQVQNTDGSLWSSSMTFSATVDPLRYSPAIHVNQEGYMPNSTKQAMVGYYAGSLGEMPIRRMPGLSSWTRTLGHRFIKVHSRHGRTWATRTRRRRISKYIRRIF